MYIGRDKALICDNLYQRILIRNEMMLMSFLIKLSMRAIIIACFAALALAGGNNQWAINGVLPQCYTGLPFNIEIGTGSANYVYVADDLPSWATLDSKRGVITGSSTTPGAWPVSIKIADSKGNHIKKQYILNVADVTSEKNNVWANDKNTNYYGRKVDKPLRVIPS